MQKALHATWQRSLGVEPGMKGKGVGRFGGSDDCVLDVAWVNGKGEGNTSGYDNWEDWVP